MRLKNLTEDLVEASKLNSDVITFNKEKIDDKQAALIISLSNLLYKINLDEKDKKLLWKYRNTDGRSQKDKRSLKIRV